MAKSATAKKPSKKVKEEVDFEIDGEEEMEAKSTKEKPAKAKILPTRAALDKMKMAVSVVIDGQPIIASKRRFSKGSTGYNGNGKIIVDDVVCQVSCNIVAVGSKELAKQGK